MKITALELVNVKSFKKLEKTTFSNSINIFTGLNNSGKSIILKSIFTLQERSLSNADVTIGQSSGYINIFYSDIYNKDENYFRYSLVENRLDEFTSNNSRLSARPQFLPTEPDNVIYPYFSKRKVVQYNSTVDEASSKSVTGNHANLSAKIDRLNSPQSDYFNEYRQACLNILGFEICAILKDSGKQAAYYIKGINGHIPVSSMGEGVPNMLGLIVDLCVAEDKIFLIEELENDLHPKALKGLLDLIISKSETNQFFISTHSNIVLKNLGGVDNTKVFKVCNDNNDEVLTKMHLSHMKEVLGAEERQLILEELGYESSDFDRWDYWLFLEESSAQTIIEYLINWFVPALKNKIYIYSCKGIGNVERRLMEFNSLFVYLNLSQIYQNKAWVLVDSGQNELEIINKLKTDYAKKGWKSRNFQNLSKHNFEEYYPDRFKIEVDKALAIPDKENRKKAKQKVLLSVVEWIKNNEELARAEFGISASEVIGLLNEIT